MEKTWEKSRCQVIFDGEDGKEVKHSFNHLKEDVTAEQVGAFSQAIDTLKQEPLNHSLVTHTYRYEPSI